MTDTTPRRIGRWESKGGKYWVELSEDEWGYDYRSDSGLGSFRMGGQYPNNLAGFMVRVARGDFQADANTTPMVQTRGSDK